MRMWDMPRGLNSDILYANFAKFIINIHKNCPRRCTILL